MARIPFNPNVINPRAQPNISPVMRSAPTIQDTSQITGRANANLGKAFAGAVDFGLNTMLKNQETQDESDAIATRSAILRLQQQEKEKLRSTSNLKEIDGINQEYKKRYDGIINGNNIDGNPFFRNQSGKKFFNDNYMSKFNVSRDNSASELKFQIDRKNTSTGYWNGIKSIPQSDYYDQPEAEIETTEYVNSLVESGFMTEEEGNSTKKTQLSNLDLERANRKLSEIDSTPAPEGPGGIGMGDLVGQKIEDYKEYIDSLKNMDDQTKELYGKKADNLLDQAKGAYKIYNKERDAEIKSRAKEYEFSLFKAVIEDKTGKLVSEIVNNPGISVDTRKKFLSEYKSGIEEERKLQAKEKLTAEDSQKKLKISYESEQVANEIYSYDPSEDLSNDKKAELVRKIKTKVSSQSTQNRLIKYLEDGNGIPDEMKEERKFKINRLKGIFGLTEESKKKMLSENVGEGFFVNPFNNRMTITEDKFGNKIETFDGLKELERIKASNSIISRYDELLKFGKVKEADEFFKKESQKWEESKKDSELLETFFKRN